MDKDKTSDEKPNLKLVKDKTKLTMKQRAFCDLIIKGKLGSQIECYMQVYDVALTKTGKIPKHAHVDCSRLMANPSVSLRIANGLKRLETNAVASTTRTRSYVLEQLMRESKESESDSARIRSLELLGKTCGLFSDTLEIKESRTSDDIESEIEEKIEALIRESEGNHQTDQQTITTKITDNPSYDGSTNFYTNSPYTEASDPGVEGTKEATIRLGVLKYDVTDYSSGYLPVGPDRSSDTGTQYFTFAFRRTTMANFDINITSSGIAGLWIAAPGTAIDSASSLNGWLDASTTYGGSGVPGANTGSGGNGS